MIMGASINVRVNTKMCTCDNYHFDEDNLMDYILAMLILVNTGVFEINEKKALIQQIRH